MISQTFLPPSAPFAEAERAQLGEVLARADATQRAWLAGFLAGLDTQGRGAAPAVPETQAAATALTLVYATESGNSEALANRAAKLARKRGFKPRVLDFATADLAEIAAQENVLVIAATWGEGEPPARAARNYTALMAPDAPRFDGARYGVLGLGDTSYAEFCAIGKHIAARLAALGGTEVIERADCDLDYQEQSDAWIDRALERLRPVSAPAVHDGVVGAASDEVPGAATAEVIEHINLNSSRSEKETIHLALAFEGAAPAYEPGDSLELLPENDPAMVDDVLAAAGHPYDTPLRATLLAERDVTTLSTLALERYAEATGHAGVRHLIESGEAREWIAGRQLIDLLEAFPAPLDAAALVGLTRTLPHRAYSIASSRKEVGDEAHLLIRAVRYATHGRARGGVASTFVTDRTGVGARLNVRLKQNPRFRLPEDPATDIVMIGPGTGVAPFRAFTQERRAIGATGRSWLFYGDQHFTHDFLYQLEWQEALHDGSLTRMDVAFSRDQPEKIYVQGRIGEQRRDLVDWIEGGASLYVCGDAKAMAKQVRAAIVDAFADVKAVGPDAAEAAVAALEDTGRYRQDVY